MHRLDNLLDHGVGLVRTFESCVQPKIFQRWTPPSNVDLRGKVAVVTGGSSGVAKELCRDLASRGATVYSGCRRTHLVPSGTYSLGPHMQKAPLSNLRNDQNANPLPGRPAHQDQLNLQSAQNSAAAAVMGGSSRLSPAGVVESAAVDAPSPQRDIGAVHALHLDLADMNSVESFAGRVLDAAGAVDILIMCAAIAGKPYKLSPQGYEIHYATNFLGHFALTHHLLPSLIEQRARVVVVSSVLHTYADDAGPDFNYSSLPLWGSVGGWWAYCRSNLAKTWFGYELQRRHPELTVPVCHPGVIDSGLTVVPTNALQSVKASLLISPVDGARTPLYCALSPDAKGNTFYHNVLGIISSSSASYDVTRAVPHYDAALKMMNSHKGAAGRDSRAAAAAAAQGAGAPVSPAAPTTNGSNSREKVRLGGTGTRK